MGILPTADPRVEPVITGPLITGPLITGPPESPELPELTEIMDGALVIFLCSEAGEAGMVQLWGEEGEEGERTSERRSFQYCTRAILHYGTQCKEMFSFYNITSSINKVP